MVWCSYIQDSLVLSEVLHCYNKDTGLGLLLLLFYQVF